MQSEQRHQTMRRLADVLPLRMQVEPSPSIIDGLIARCVVLALPGIAALLPGMRCEVGSIGTAGQVSPEALTDIVVEALFVGHEPVLRLRMVRKAVLALENLMLGGGGDEATGRLDRKLTPLDRRLVSAVAEVVVSAFAAAGNENGVPLTVTSIEVIADGKRPTRLSEDVVPITLELRDEERTLPIVVDVPQQLVCLAPQDKPGGSSKATSVLRSGVDLQTVGPETFPHTPVVVDAALEALGMSLAEVNAIRPGDTLALVGDSASRVVLECEGLALFRGTVGHRGGEILVRIDEPLDLSRDQVAGRPSPVSEASAMSERKL